MKTFLVFSTLLFISGSTFAQRDFDIANIKGGEYFKNDSLRYLEGKWIGVNDNNDTLRVILKFIEKEQFDPVYFDCLRGWHEYTENGIVESSSMKDTFDFRNSTFTIITSAVDGNIIFTMRDKGKSMGDVAGIITYNPSAPNELFFKILGFNDQPTVHIQGTPPPPLRERSKLTVTKEWKMVRVTN